MLLFYNYEDLLRDISVDFFESITKHPIQYVPIISFLRNIIWWLVWH